MNEAKELVKMAKELVSVKSDFTVIKPLQLKKEGATRDSLENARRILSAGYGLMNGNFVYNKNMAVWTTTAFFMRPSDRAKASHVFKGFSFGYGGEGPRGMYNFLDMFRWGPDSKKILENNQAFPDKGSIRLEELT